MKILRLISFLSILLLTSLVITSCSIKQPAKYKLGDISQRVSLKGGVFRLGSIRYLPAESGAAKPTQVVNLSTLPGFGHDFNFDRPVSEIVSQALRAELRAAGAEELGTAKIIININIVEASVDVRGLGYGGWRVFFHMRARVMNAAGRELYARDFGRMTKTPGATSVWTDDMMVLIREAIEAFIADHEFGAVLN
jgi:hypothetical protein